MNPPGYRPAWVDVTLAALWVVLIYGAPITAGLLLGPITQHQER